MISPLMSNKTKICINLVSCCDDHKIVCIKCDPCKYLLVRLKSQSKFASKMSQGILIDPCDSEEDEDNIID